MVSGVSSPLTNLRSTRPPPQPLWKNHTGGHPLPSSTHVAERLSNHKIGALTGKRRGFHIHTHTHGAHLPPPPFLLPRLNSLFHCGGWCPSVMAQRAHPPSSRFLCCLETISVNSLNYGHRGSVGIEVGDTCLFRQRFIGFSSPPGRGGGKPNS